MIKRLYWWTGKNIGDAISPLIVEWMLGHKVQYGVARTFWNELWVFLRERIKYTLIPQHYNLTLFISS